MESAMLLLDMAMDYSVTPQDLHSQPLDDLLRSLGNVNPAEGMTHEAASRRRHAEGANVVRPPVSCPSWLCCLLPCLTSSKLVRLFREVQAPDATVLREARQLRMDASALVRGDVVTVSAGERVPADCRVLDVEDGFTVDVAALTGEETLVVGSRACTDNNPLASANMLFMAAECVQGSCTAVVVETGERTMWAKLVRSGKWPPDRRLLE